MKSTSRLVRRLAPTLALVGLAAVSFPLSAGAQEGSQPAGGTPRFSGSAVPGSMGIPQPEPKITLTLPVKRTLARVLHEVFKQAPGYEYRVAVPSEGLYTADFKDEPLSQVLRKVAAQAPGTEPLVFAFQRNLIGGGGTYVFHREYIEVGLIQGEPRVSVANARLTQVLPEIFKVLKTPYRVEKDVPPVLVSLQLRPTNWDQVLPQLMLEAHRVEPGLGYSKDGDTYVIHLHKSPTGISATGQPVPGFNGRRTSIAVVNTPLRDAVAQLLRGSTWKYQVARSLEEVRVTYSTTNYPELAALKDLLRQASANRGPITYREGMGVLYIEPGGLPGETYLASRRDVQSSARTSSYRANMEKIRATVKILEGAYGVTIRVGTNVPDLPVTFEVRNATIDAALQSLVTAARASLPNLVSRTVDEKVYSLELSGQQ